MIARIRFAPHASNPYFLASIVSLMPRIQWNKSTTPITIGIRLMMTAGSARNQIPTASTRMPITTDNPFVTMLKKKLPRYTTPITIMPMARTLPITFNTPLFQIMKTTPSKMHKTEDNKKSALILRKNSFIRPTSPFWLATAKDSENLRIFRSSSRPLLFCYGKRLGKFSNLPQFISPSLILLRQKTRKIFDFPRSRARSHVFSKILECKHSEVLLKPRSLLPSRTL